VDALDALSNLQFLWIQTKSPIDPSVFGRLHRLRYLAATFPIDSDFSFVEQMPYLQTLCILNVGKQHDLKPLAKTTRLRCLALNPEERNSDGVLSFDNVKDFQKDRPDVNVVETGGGVCLGSFWLLPVVVIAAVVAWQIRRRTGARAIPRVRAD